MDFQLTEEQPMVQKTAREFADDRGPAPVAAAIDREHRHPAELVGRDGRAWGFWASSVPEEWGGGGMDVVSYVIAMEEISRACASTGVIMSVNNSLVCDPINRFGTEAQKQALADAAGLGQAAGLLRAVASPRPAPTPPRSARPRSSRPMAPGSSAAPRTGSPTARSPTSACCSAMNDRSMGAQRHHSVHRRRWHRDGVRCGKPDDKLGIRGSDVVADVLEDVRLPGQRAAGRGRRRLQGRHVDARRRPHRHRVAGPRHRARRVRSGPRLGPRAQDLRQGDQPAPGDPVQAGRHGDRDRRGAAPDPARGVAQGPEAAVRQGVGHGQALRLGRRQQVRARGHRRSSAATAT